MHAVPLEEHGAVVEHAGAGRDQHVAVGHQRGRAVSRVELTRRDGRKVGRRRPSVIHAVEHGVVARRADTEHGAVGPKHVGAELERGLLGGVVGERDQRAAGARPGPSRRREHLRFHRLDVVLGIDGKHSAVAEQRPALFVVGLVFLAGGDRGPCQVGRIEDSVERRAAVGEHEAAIGEHDALSVADFGERSGLGDRRPLVHHRIIDRTQRRPDFCPAAVVLATFGDQPPVGQDRRREVERRVARRHLRDRRPRAGPIAAGVVRSDRVPAAEVGVLRNHPAVRQHERDARRRTRGYVRDRRERLRGGNQPGLQPIVGLGEFRRRRRGHHAPRGRGDHYAD